jgi:hypothetical protein
MDVIMFSSGSVAIPCGYECDYGDFSSIFLSFSSFTELIGGLMVLLWTI